MIFQITFKNKKTRKFLEVVRNCEKLKGFKRTEDQCMLTLLDNEIAQHKKLINGILTRIEDWDDCKYTINGEEVSSENFRENIDKYETLSRQGRAANAAFSDEGESGRPYPVYESGDSDSADKVTGEKDSFRSNRDKDDTQSSNNSSLDNVVNSIFNTFSNFDLFNGDKEGDGSSKSSVGNFFNDLLTDFDSSDSPFKPGDRKKRNIPNTTFKDIGGIEPVIDQVKEVIELPLVAPRLLQFYQIKPHKGILLYGPPGCGKTMLAKAVANEIKAHFISISGPEIQNKYYGQSEENLRSIFKEAASKAPSIIYFDEFDSIAGKRNQDMDPYNSRLANQLLTLLDGLEENSGICVIASTNRIDMIDPAIKRPGRFDYILEVNKPTLQGCKEIFNIYTDRMPIEESFDRDAFAEKYLLGTTGAEIAFIATEAAYNSIRRTVDIDAVINGNNVYLTEKNVITEDDFLTAIGTLEENREKILLTNSD